MRRPRWWRRSLIVLAIAVGAFMALPVAHAQQVFVPGAVVALEGTPHLWIADDQGVLHWGGDTRALSGRHINWSARTEVSLAGLRTLPKGDPWLSAGLLKQGDPIYLVKWETEWAQPRLLHIQSIADVEIFGIDETNYGNFVLDVATWEARYGISVASLQRAELPPAVPSAGMTATTPVSAASSTIPYQVISGYDGGGGTLNLPQGDITLKLQFGGWGSGPVTVTYRIDDGAPIHLINNARVAYYGEMVFNVPRAASYTFGVTAARDWRIWIGNEPGLPSVPLPLANCRATMRWHGSADGIHQAIYDCDGAQLEGTSYDEVNSDPTYWVVWYRDGRFLAVTSTGSAVGTDHVAVSYQVVRGYNSGAGNLNLPAGRVELMLEYGNWNSAPLTLTIETPTGELIRLIDAETISYRTSLAVSVTHPGTHRVQVDAQRDWRLWVGADTAAIDDDLAKVEVPVRRCSTRNDWKVRDRVYRADFKCPEFILRGAYYPGLNSDTGFWVVWSEEDEFREVTFHRN